jgi:hypothetical protein
MQPRVTQVGPLASSSATKISASQTPGGAGAIALNGSAGTAVANNICTSQSGTVNTPLIINGALSQTGYASPTVGVTGATIASLPTASPIYITSAGNDSAITFKVVGIAATPSSFPAVISETLQGTNASVVASKNAYKQILSVTPSGNTGSTVTVGSMGFATLDLARQVIITSGGNDTAITFTITGTDWSGDVISEIVTGASGAAAASVLDYLTVTSVVANGAPASTVTVGTNGVAHSPWINLDTWSLGTVSCQAVVTGTANYTIEVSNDDPNSFANPVAAASMTWDDNFANATGQTSSLEFGIAQAPLWMRILLNSGSGSVRLTAIQHGSVAY